VIVTVKEPKNREEQAEYYDFQMSEIEFSFVARLTFAVIGTLFLAWSVVLVMNIGTTREVNVIQWEVSLSFNTVLK